MERTGRKHQRDITDLPRETKRSKVDNKLKDILTFETLVKEFVGVHILKNLSPKELTRLGLVSKVFHNIVSQEVDIGREVKLAFAKEGRPTYLIKLFLEGKGSFIFLEHYFKFIEESDDEGVNKFLKSYFMKHLLKITNKIKKKDECFPVDTAIKIFNHVAYFIPYYDVIYFISEIFTYPECFAQLVPLYFQLIKQMAEEPNNTLYPHFNPETMNEDTLFSQFNWEIILDQLSRNFVKHPNKKVCKKIFEIVTDSHFLKKLKYLNHHNKVAVLIYHSLFLDDSIDLLRIQQIGSDSLYSLPFLKLMVSAKVVSSNSERNYDPNAFIKNTIFPKGTPKQLTFYGSEQIKQIFLDELDFSQLEELLESSEGLRILINALFIHDFGKLLAKARSLVSERGFDALLDIRFPSDDILEGNKLNLKRVYSVVLNYGRFKTDGWDFLQCDDFYRTAPVLQSAIDIYLNLKVSTNLLDFLLVAITVFDDFTIKSIFDDLIGLLNEEEQKTLVSRYLSVKMPANSKKDFLVKILYRKYVSLDTFFQYAADFTAVQKATLIDMMIITHKFVEEDKLLELIKYFDQILKDSERETVYERLVKKNLGERRTGNLSNRQLLTLKRSLGFVVLPKLSSDKKYHYLLKLFDAGGISDCDLLDFRF